MNLHSLQNYFNFEEVANDTLDLLCHLLGSKTYFIAHTNQQDVGILKSVNHGECAIQEGIQLSVQESYCGLIYLSGQEPLLIEDASQHPMTKDLEVTRTAKIGSYLGIPIILQDGTMFGTLCAVDSKPYHFTPQEVEIVSKLSKFLSHALDLAQVAGGFYLKSKALESTANAVAIANHTGHITWVNPAFTHLTGYTLDETCDHQLNIFGSPDRMERMAMCNLAAKSEFWQGEQINRRKDGSLYHEEMTITPVLNADGSAAHFIAIKQDITERKEAEARLDYLAHYDPLTNLPNRVMFRDCLIEAIEFAEMNGSMLSVLFLDLDRFKNINDTLGHDIGDLLLKEIAQRINSCVGAVDVVSRHSGDEFTVILTLVNDAQEVARTAQQISEAISQPVTLGGYELYVSTSIGISLYPEDGRDWETLLKHADIAMYHAKSLGRHNHQFYTEDMNAQSRLELENYLRKALDKNEFTLHYQPKVDLITGQMIGMEALLRWIHPTLGFVPPDKFIPIAEDIGMIGPIGEWVLRTACKQNRMWQEAGLPPLCVAVNLSVSQFQYLNLVDQVKTVLDETGLDPQWLELEITESIIIQNTEKVINVLLRLKELGIQISIDDFGTGYSSLRYLQMLPIDTLKIDRSFVQDIEDDQGDATAIPKAVISMAHSLNLKVIAEGVETEAQLGFLRNQHCDMMQGYLFSRPLPQPDFEKLLAEHAALHNG